MLAAAAGSSTDGYRWGPARNSVLTGRYNVNVLIIGRRAYFRRPISMTNQCKIFWSKLPHLVPIIYQLLTSILTFFFIFSRYKFEVSSVLMCIVHWNVIIIFIKPCRVWWPNPINNIIEHVREWGDLETLFLTCWYTSGLHLFVEE